MTQLRESMKVFLNKELEGYEEAIYESKCKCNEAIIEANLLMDKFYEKDNIIDGDSMCTIVELLKDLSLDLTHIIN